MIKYSHSDDALREDELRRRVMRGFIEMNVLMVFQGENRFYGDRLIRGGNQDGRDDEEVSFLILMKSID